MSDEHYPPCAAAQAFVEQLKCELDYAKRDVTKVRRDAALSENARRAEIQRLRPFEDLCADLQKLLLRRPRWIPLKERVPEGNGPHVVIHPDRGAVVVVGLLSSTMPYTHYLVPGEPDESILAAAAEE